MFYVINLKDANRTFVYDVDEKLWHEWSSRIPNSEPTGTGTPPASTIGFFNMIMLQIVIQEQHIYNILIVDTCFTLILVNLIMLMNIIT